ncbi:MAG: dynamin family protein, partial [Verrucomicrobiota bacterium]|nr:dynamin family protein [Verrucomicrobiota bacterium]
MFDSIADRKKKLNNHIDMAIDIAKKNRRDKIAELFCSIKNQIESLRYTIAIIGHIKRGKSTLLNTMFGRSNDYISPVQSKVCTAAIVHYIDQKAVNFEEEQALIYFYDINKEPLQVSFDEIREYITEEMNPGNKKGIKKIEVYGDFPILNETVTLVDTPGRGSIHDYHEILIDEFLPCTDAIIQPIAADLPLEAEEKKFLDSLSQKQKERVFFVLTKCDQLNDDELQDSVDFVKSNIRDAGFSINKLYTTSAKPVFDALTEGAEPVQIKKLKQKYGISLLEKDIENFVSTKSDKNEILARRMTAVFSEIKTFAESSMICIKSELEALDMDYVTLEEELIKTEKAKEKLSRQKSQAIKTFGTKYSRIVERFILKFKNKSSTIANKLEMSMEKNGLFKNVSASFK